MRCLKRFAARRGTPRKFVSDNGRTFKADKVELVSGCCGSWNPAVLYGGVVCHQVWLVGDYITVQLCHC